MVERPSAVSSVGLAVYDLSDPLRQAGSGRAVAAACTGSSGRAAATGLVWVTDRIGGGLYVLAPDPRLAALMDDASTAVGPRG
jgi:hypothetical protein